MSYFFYEVIIIDPKLNSIIGSLAVVFFLVSSARLFYVTLFIEEGQFLSTVKSRRFIVALVIFIVGVLGLYSDDIFFSIKSALQSPQIDLRYRVL